MASQAPSQQELRNLDFMSTHVTDSVQLFLQREAAILAHCSTFRDDLCAAADCISDVPEGVERIPELRTILKNVLVMEAEIAAHKSAALSVAQSYVPSLDVTQWADVLAAGVQAQMLSNPCDPEASAEMRRFDQEAGVARASVGDDDDVVCEDNATGASDKCPLSQKSVFELVDPVVDERGYFYSAAALAQYLGTRVSVRCPVAGTQHFVSRATVSADKAKRMIKKMRRRAAMQGPQEGNRRQQDIVLDAE